ncbi:MAG: 8-amino-7-oxononanoate synthase [Gammaproteobacteria bacterium]|nr:8-amino-7-oxononanoate synthase [Gammaproteobacteria bacterium]
MWDLRDELARREAAGLYRRRRTVDGPQGPVLSVDDRALLTFCSNDYLGLAGHPAVIAAFQRAAADYGVGSGAAHLVAGHMRPHHALEEELAAFTGYPRTLLFSTGYMANLGAVAGLLGAGDAVFEDRLNHASLLDAGLLSRARFTRFAHGDVAALAQDLAASKGRRKLVVTDGVFSMDGDIAPLAVLAETCRAQGAALMVDDAHGLGVIGAAGRGSLEVHGLGAQHVPMLVGTLGKGFGTFGAFVAGEEDVIETLIQQARSYIFTTAMPPAVAEATRVSLRLVQQEGWRREKLQTLIARFRAGAAQLGLPLMDSSTPIQPILIGDPQHALAMSAALEARGILVSAIRPPTVPEGTARLRVTLSATHSEAQVDCLLDVLNELPVS